MPATLHILLGVVLLIYNLLLNECNRIDNEVGAEELAARQREVDEKWEVASLQLLAAEKDLREHGSNIVIMTNRLHRYEAIARGDKKENLMLSNLSDTRKKS